MNCSWVNALDDQSKARRCLFVSEDRALAETKADEFKRCGWREVRVCGSLEEFERWKRDARTDSSFAR
jgi:hypothetical protein